MWHRARWLHDDTSRSTLMPDTMNATTRDTTSSSRAAIALAWLVVGLPLAWGVSQTIVKSLALFE
jgi:hypothetical protein